MATGVWVMFGISVKSVVMDSFKTQHLSLCKIDQKYIHKGSIDKFYY